MNYDGVCRTAPATPGLLNTVLQKYMWTLYLPYAAYVPVLGAEYFQIPCRVIFQGFLAEDEQKTKLVSAHSSLTSFQNSFPNKKGWFKTAQQTWNLAHTLHEQKIWVQDFTPNIA